MAEETGMIVDIGSWVLNEACAEAAQWMAQWPDRRLCVSVNISSRQVLKTDIYRRDRPRCASYQRP